MQKKRLKVSPVVQARPPETKAPQPKQWKFDVQHSDPLASALSHCMRLRGHDVNTAQLIAGLPLDNAGRLTPKEAVRAAEQYGARTNVSRRKLDELPASVLPVVLFLTERDACVLTALDGNKASVIWHQRSDQPISMDREELEARYAGHVMLLSLPGMAGPERDVTEKSTRHWYWSVAARFWPDYVQVAVASAVINILALALPLFTMNVYDRVFPNAALITLWSLVTGVGIALIFDALLKWIRARIVDRVSRRVDLAVSSEIFRHLADLRLDAAQGPTGGLLNNLKDYEQVRDFFSSQTVASITDLLFGFLFVAVIFYIGGPLAYPPAIGLCIVLIMGLLILSPLRKSSQAAQQSSGLKNAVAVEAVADLETLKAVSGQNRMQARWERTVTESAVAQEKNRRLANFATTTTGLIQQISSISIVIIGVYLALQGEITMGAVIAAMILSGRAMAPTAAIAGLFVRAGFAVSTLRSLNQMMSLPSDKAAPNGHLNARIEQGVYEFRDVGMRYTGAAVPALSAINLQTKPGEHVGIIGAVGSGKTTLVRLMSGLYSPSDGIVLIDGLNMNQIDPAQLRREVQLVPQDSVLFSGTLAENIAFGQHQATGEDVLRVARLTGLDELIAEHPEGFAMPIEERGRNLSGGQRQLIALARALLSRPKVLILDEPTSSMDTQTERKFVQSLERVLAVWDVTLIVSTHRSSLLELVDTLVFLEKGEIKHVGPKDAVLKSLKSRQDKNNG